jgi:hypothetical protein
VIRAYIDFLISTYLSNSHFKFPTIWTIFFNSQLHLTIPFCLFNSLIHFTCYPFPEIFTSFPFPPNRANSPFYPSVRSSSPTYLTSIFISNSADGLVSGEVLCDTLRLVWCVCLRPSLYLPQWFLDITWERISNFVLLFGTIKCRPSSNFSVIR